MCGDGFRHGVGKLNVSEMCVQSKCQLSNDLHNSPPRTQNTIDGRDAFLTNASIAATN